MTTASQRASTRTRLFLFTGGIVITSLVVLGVISGNGWLPTTDRFSNRKDRLGKPLAKNAPTSWQTIAPDPTPLPLAREYVYAGGSRLLSVIDANAQETPPADLAIWRPSSGYWWVLNGSVNGDYSTNYAVSFGMNGDRPEPGDYS